MSASFIRMKILSIFIFCSISCVKHEIKENPLPLVEAFENYPSLKEIKSETYAFQENEAWWASFENKTLDTLLRELLRNNFSIQKAKAELEAALARYDKEGAGLFPELSLNGEVSQVFQDKSDEGRDRFTQSHGLTIDWDLDVFGEIRSLSLSKKYTMMVSKAALDTLILAKTTEFAEAFFSGLAAHEKIKLLHEQIRFDQQSLQLIQLRRSQGLGSNIDVLQQEGQLAESRALIPKVEGDLWTFESKMDILLGYHTDGKKRLPYDSSLIVSKDPIPLTVASHLLLQRPDLRLEKYRLISKDADIATAIARRFPRIALQGQLGYVKTSTYSGPAAALLGNLAMPLLDWGARRAEVRANKHLYEAQLYAFTESYLEAFADVDQLLYLEAKQRDFLRRLRERQEILRKTVFESEERYKQGVADYLPVLNALQDLRRLERDLIDEKLKLLTLRIRLNQAIGAPVPHQKGKKI